MFAKGRIEERYPGEMRVCNGCGRPFAVLKMFKVTTHRGVNDMCSACADAKEKSVASEAASH
jgi:hypothetical protein